MRRRWLSEARGRARLTQAALAQAVGVDSATVSRWERGRQGIYRRHFGLLADALGWSVSKLERHVDGEVPRSDTALESPSRPPSAGPEVMSNPWHLLDTITRSNISAATVEDMEAAMWRSAAQFPTVAAGSLARKTGVLLARTHDALGYPQAVQVRRRLIRLLGYLAGLQASLSFDESDPNTAVASWFRLARYAAAEAEDDDLTAWLLAHEALVSHLSGRSAQETYRLLAEASDRSQRTLPRRRSWVLALKARSAGVLGNAEEATHLLADAHDALASAGPADGPDFFDEPRLDGIRGTTLLNLRQADAAADALIGALQRRPESHTRGRAWLTLDLAVCRARQGEVDEAARLSLEGLELAGGPVQSITARAWSVADEVSAAGGRHLVGELTDRLVESSGPRP